jgi:hypothetical protein
MRYRALEYYIYRANNSLCSDAICNPRYPWVEIAVENAREVFAFRGRERERWLMQRESF